jgi:hypothetical protein
LHAVGELWHFKHGEVAIDVVADQLCCGAGAVGEDDLVATPAVHNVIVGDDVPLIVVDEAAAATQGGHDNVDDGGIRRLV